MDTLTAIKESGMAPPEFWYLATFVLLGLIALLMTVIIFFGSRFFKKLDTTLDSFSLSITKLTEMTTIHDVEIKALKDQNNKRRR